MSVGSLELKVKTLYMQHTDGLTDIEVAEALCITRSAVWKIRQRLKPVQKGRGRYTLVPRNEDILFAKAVLKRIRVV